MDSSKVATVGCPIIAEFVDDASDFVPIDVPPSKEAASAAKRFWMRIIRRYSEQLPGQRGRVRIRDSAEPNLGRYVVRYADNPARRAARMLQPSDLTPEPVDSDAPRLTGVELDVSDGLFLAVIERGGLFRHSEDQVNPDFVRESVTPIPWIDVVQIQFDLGRPVADPESAASRSVGES